MIKLILTITFLVGSLGGGLYAVYPLYEDYQRQLKVNEVLTEELENIKVYVADLQNIKETIEKKEEDFAKMWSALPEDHDAPSLFLYLEDLMEENNLNVEAPFGEFSIEEYVLEARSEEEEPSEHARLKETHFPLSLTGEYDDIKGFLRDTEDVIRLIAMNNIIIQRGGERGIGPLDTASLSADTGEEELNIMIYAKTYSY